LTEKERTKEMRERYSWRLNVDKQLRAPCKVLAQASGKEVRVFVSEILAEHLTDIKPINEGDEQRGF
jgi:hypothetical protein